MRDFFFNVFNGFLIVCVIYGFICLLLTFGVLLKFYLSMRNEPVAMLFTTDEVEKLASIKARMAHVKGPDR